MSTVSLILQTAPGSRHMYLTPFTEKETATDKLQIYA